MPDWRSIVAMLLLSVWMGMPALACLPDASMTAAEMACCRKMAGDCQMGTAQHPCCKTTVRSHPSDAAVDRSAVQIQPAVRVNVSASVTPPAFAPHDDANIELRGLPPPAPPGVNSVLRL
ncbi:MAG: hypothetical protein H0X25_13675 [Acidobacteriales bacterium]|nr:hypothetical protein [Terriglobales bacterium]